MADRTGQIGPDSILLYSTFRNERVRLPYFLDYYRNLGVNHFLMVDNGSDDGGREYLATQPDVSIWSTNHSYKRARFGVDWLNWLQFKYGHDHWCLVVDPDEFFVYPFCDTRPLRALTDWLDASSIKSFSAMLLDMYPKGPFDAQPYHEGQDPFEIAQWFDSGNYTIQRNRKYGNLWIQGGPRARRFFAAEPRRAPTLNKVPLVRWNRRFAYVNSTHAILPPRLNRVYATDGGERISGALLHTKFLRGIVEKSAEEKHRREHFANSTLYDSYYDSLVADPQLWCDRSSRYTGWRGLEAMGLMSRGGWR